MNIKNVLEMFTVCSICWLKPTCEFPTLVDNLYSHYLLSGCNTYMEVADEFNIERLRPNFGHGD